MPTDQLSDLAGVYFIEGEATNRVKIGYASNVLRRALTLASGCPVPLIIRAFIPGEIDMERDYHEQFASCRTHGEWFALADDLAGFIASCALPEPIRVLGTEFEPSRYKKLIDTRRKRPRSTLRPKPRYAFDPYNTARREHSW